MSNQQLKVSVSDGKTADTVIGAVLMVLLGIATLVALYFVAKTVAVVAAYCIIILVGIAVLPTLTTKRKEWGKKTLRDYVSKVLQEKEKQVTDEAVLEYCRVLPVIGLLYLVLYPISVAFIGMQPEFRVFPMNVLSLLAFSYGLYSGLRMLAKYSDIPALLDKPILVRSRVILSSIEPLYALAVLSKAFGIF